MKVKEYTSIHICLKCKTQTYAQYTDSDWFNFSKPFITVGDKKNFLGDAGVSLRTLKYACINLHALLYRM